MDKRKKIIQVGINGMGAIGKLVYRALSPVSGIEVVKVNDLAPRSSLEYLLRRDSVHRRFPGHINNFEYSCESNPRNISWQGIDVVVDSTPSFNTSEDLSKHLESGASYVVRTSPLKGVLDCTQTIIPGINDSELDLERFKVISMASCTTNCLAPMVKVLKEYCEKTRNTLEEIDFVTVHACTNDQAIKDSFHPDARRGRDVNNIIETSTGASSQIGLFFPELVGRIHGTAYRVPVSDGSLLEVRVKTRNPIDVSMVNAAFKEATEKGFNEYLGYETMPLVSSDCIGDKHTCVYLESSAVQLSDDKIKLVSLYDNELAYASKVAELVSKIGRIVCDPIKRLFAGYEREMAVESWRFDPIPGDCDNITELCGSGIDNALKTMADEEEWSISKQGKGYLLGAGDFTYFAEVGNQVLNLYDRTGAIIDLSTNKEMHLANKALVQKHFAKEMYTQEDLEWDRSMECSPDDWEDD